MKTILMLAGQPVEAERRSFKVLQEPVSLYELEDGTTVRVRLVVTEIFLLETKDEVTGAPRPFVQFQPVATVELPETRANSTVSAPKVN